MDTHVFKQIDDNDIKADIYAVAGEQRRGAVLFIHGGGLILGSRKAILPSHIAAFNDGGFHFISMAY